jgi:hypothetical protein
MMTKNKMAVRYSPEVRARAVLMVFDHQASHEKQAAAIAAIAVKIGCIPLPPQASQRPTRSEILALCLTSSAIMP